MNTPSTKSKTKKIQVRGLDYLETVLQKILDVSMPIHIRMHKQLFTNLCGVN